MSDQQLRSGGAERIGRYQVETPIGVGGFARVVRAYDESLDDSVAIKILAENWAEDAEIRERFLEEARLLRKVRSEYLITVHDIGELADGRPYFVMQFADAGTLGARLASKVGAGLDAGSARLVIEALAGGLSALHGAGVIHRDVNPKNLLIRRTDSKHDDRAARATQLRPGLVAPDERLLLGDLGLAKDVVRAGSAAVSMVGGTAHYIPPEQADPNGTVTPATDVYAATAVMWECLTGTPPPDPPDLSAKVAGLDSEWRDFFATGLASDAAARYQTMESWREAAFASLRDEAVVDTGFSPRRYEAAGDHNPYMGLAAFQPEDADRFFGRDSLIEDLVERLRHKRMLIVAGPSGSGKSSLVRAGLIPAVAEGAITGSGRWPIALLNPGTDPLGELAYQLSKLVIAATQQSAPPTSGADLASDPNRGRLLAETVTDATGGAVIVIDQFEELFTQGQPRDAQRQFLDALAALVDSAASKVRVVAAVRVDFYGRSASFPWLADKITDNQVLVGPMTTAELRQAIEEPARRAGLVIEDGLVDTMLDDTGTDPGTLPLLSHALAETWRRRRGNTMTVDGYQAAGGVSGAIAQTANALYDGRFDDEERAAVRILMLRLVSPGEGTPDTRRSLPLSAVFTEEPGVLARVTEQMTEARLLTIDEEAIEIAHEALIRTWPRLRGWIEENRDDLRTREHIGRAASEWLEQDRAADLLYRGTPLQSALEWAATRPDVLEPADQAFLDASRAAHEAEVAEKEGAAARLRRIRLVAVGVLSGLTLVAVAASLVAYGALRDTRAQFAQSLATQSVPLVEENPRLALALAVEAISRGQTDSIEARTTLIEANRALAGAALAPAASGSAVGDALSIAVRNDGSLIAVGYRDGSLQLWDPMAGQPKGDPVRIHERGVNDVAFTPDGARLITVSDDETVRFWDVSGPSTVTPGASGMHEGIVWRLAVSPDGSRVATASEDGTIREWDTATGQQIGAPLADMSRDFLSVAYSPDGQTLMAGNGRGEVIGWDVAGRQEVVGLFNAHESDVWHIRFDPTGATFATSSSDGSIKLFDASGTELAVPYSGAATGNEPGLVFAADGTMYAGTEDGRIGAWTVADGMVAITPTGHGGQVTDIAVTPHGEVVSLATDQTFRIWTAVATSVSEPLPGLGAGAFGVAVALDGTIAVGDGVGIVHVFPPGSSEARQIPAHGAVVTGLAFSDDGTRLVSVAGDGTWALLDVAAGTRLAGPVAADQGTVDAVAFADEGVFTGGDVGTVKLWNTDGTLRRTLTETHAGGVTALAAGAGRVASSDRSGLVRVFDAGSGDLVGTAFRADDNTIWSLAFSMDGSLLATASADEVVAIWEADSAEQIAVLTPHGEPVTGVAFVDDATVVSLALDGTVRVWDASLGRQLGSALAGHSDHSWRLGAGAASGMFVTTSRDGTAQVWRMLDLSEACASSQGTFDAEQQRRYLGEDNSSVGCMIGAGS